MNKLIGVGTASARARTILGLTTAVVLSVGFTAAIPALYAVKVIIPVRLAILFFVQAVFFGIAILANNRIEKLGFAELGYSRKRIASQLLWAFVIFVVLSVIFIAFPLLMGLRDIFPQRDLLLFAIPYTFTVGFAEETLFRGYLLKGLLRIRLPKIAAIIASSAIFGAWHYMNNGSMLQVGITGIIGIVFAVPLIYSRRCSLLSVALAHGAYDALLNIFAYLPL
ncbi:MAG: CPBP family intramembrane metalloprotease [Oscillospiraceae bacterium]|nr:CPBP family intramembrane metalloprotease [Oscillospiraceae bacterium]